LPAVGATVTISDYRLPALLICYVEHTVCNTHLLPLRLGAVRYLPLRCITTLPRNTFYTELRVDAPLPTVGWNGAVLLPEHLPELPPFVVLPVGAVIPDYVALEQLPDWCYQYYYSNE